MGTNLKINFVHHECGTRIILYLPAGLFTGLRAGLLSDTFKKYELMLRHFPEGLTRLIIEAE
jgi:hypothetical protein